MNLVKSLGMRCLAAYLILNGLIVIFGVRLGVFYLILPLLAIVAGVLILMGK